MVNVEYSGVDEEAKVDSYVHCPGFIPSNESRGSCALVLLFDLSAFDNHSILPQLLCAVNIRVGMTLFF